MSAASWSVITAATPFLAYLGPHTLALMTFTRFLMGLLQGKNVTGVSTLTARNLVAGCVVAFSCRLLVQNISDGLKEKVFSILNVPFEELQSKEFNYPTTEHLLTPDSTDH